MAVDDATFEGDSDTVVVTFPARTERQGLHRKGFGEDFFKKNRISAVLVKAAWNHWFQVEDTFDAIGAIRSLTRKFRRVVTYGSSMGGYSAAMLSGALNADTIIAISPQYSIDRWKVPFEKRWAQDAINIKFIHDCIELSINRKSDLFLIYDPFTPDSDHANRLLALSDRPKPLRVPFGGHPAGTFLVEAGCISSIVLGLVGGTLSSSAARQIIRASRQRTGSYWINAAAQFARTKPELAAKLVEQAALLNHDNASVYFRTGKVLTRLGRLAEAAHAFEAAARSKSSVAKYQTEWGLSLLQAARPDAAIRVLNQAVEIDAKSMRARLGIATALLDQDRVDLALLELDRAAQIETDNPAINLLRLRIASKSDAGMPPLTLPAHKPPPPPPAHNPSASAQPASGSAPAALPDC